MPRVTTTEASGHFSAEEMGLGWDFFNLKQEFWVEWKLWKLACFEKGVHLLHEATWFITVSRVSR